MTPIDPSAFIGRCSMGSAPSVPGLFQSKTAMSPVPATMRAAVVAITIFVSSA